MVEPIAEVGYLAGICGSEDDTDWLKVLVDSSRRLVVAIAAFAAAVEVTQDTPGDLLTGIHGHVGGAWQKQPLIFGYSGMVGQYIPDDSADEGTNTYDTTTVPPGEVHVYTHFYAVNVDTDPEYVVMSVYDGASRYYLHREASPGIGNSVEAPNPIIVGPGGSVRAAIAGCAANDMIRVSVSGYRMDIDL